MDKVISRALKKLRKSIRLTQSEFGKEIGMSRSKVSSWEIGRRDISIMDALLISDYFDVSLDCLLIPDKINVKKTVDVLEQCIRNVGTLDESYALKKELARKIEEVLCVNEEEALVDLGN